MPTEPVRRHGIHSRDGQFHEAKPAILSGQVHGGEVGMGPGQSRTVTLTPRAGRYKVHCSHFFHKQLGMKGTIVVT